MLICIYIYKFSGFKDKDLLLKENLLYLILWINSR